MIIAVKSLLLRDNRALILQRSQSDRSAPGMWEFPGGRVEFGESLHEALARELFEETGLSGDIGPVTYADSVMSGPHRQVVVINFLVQAHPGDVHISFEHEDFRWAGLAEMRAMLGKRIVRNLDVYKVLERPDVDITPG